MGGCEFPDVADQLLQTSVGLKLTLIILQVSSKEVLIRVSLDKAKGWQGSLTSPVAVAQSLFLGHLSRYLHILAQGPFLHLQSSNAGLSSSLDHSRNPPYSHPPGASTSLFYLQRRLHLHWHMPLSQPGTLLILAGQLDQHLQLYFIILTLFSQPNRFIGSRG